MYRVFFFLSIVLSSSSMTYTQESTGDDINQNWSQTEIEEVELTLSPAKVTTKSRATILNNNLEVVVSVDTYKRKNNEKAWIEYKWLWQVFCRDLRSEKPLKPTWTVVVSKSVNDYTWISPGNSDKSLCPIGYDLRMNKQGRDYLVVSDKRDENGAIVGIFVIEENGDLNLAPAAAELKSWKAIEKADDQN
jgi:hypothetical protein